MGTKCPGKPSQIDRVVKQVNVTYTYVLPTVSTWEQFPSMEIKYYIGQAQYVKVGYHLAVRLGTCNFFATRTIIDGTENTYLRSSTGSLYHHNHVAFVPVWTEPGWHEARVEVRHNGGFYNVINSDWNTALFSVEYFEY